MHQLAFGSSALSPPFESRSSVLTSPSFCCLRSTASWPQRPFGSKFIGRRLKSIRFESKPVLRRLIPCEIKVNSSLPDEPDKKEPAPVHQDVDFDKLVRSFKAVALPYWNSEEKWEARSGLAALVVLGLMQSGISVVYSFVGRDFWNALASKDSDQFFKMLSIYAACFAVGTPIVVMYGYVRDMVSLRWRKWLTNEFLKKYLDGRAYYRLNAEAQGGMGPGALIDNPDQRICDDVNQFADSSLSFFLVIMNSVIDLVSFSGILWSIYPPLFIVLIFYSAFGTGVTSVLGQRLVMLNFEQLKKEANFRYSLVRVRENAESIAFYQGEQQERGSVAKRLQNAVDNSGNLISWQRNLGFFTNGYRYFIQILPAAVVAPLYFAGRFEIGVVQQAYSAFNHVLGDLSIIVNRVQSLSAFSAGIDRLGEFELALRESSNGMSPGGSPEGSTELSLADPPSMIELVCNDDSAGLPAVPCLMMNDVTICTPDGRKTLIRHLSLSIRTGERLLIVGPSGCGKSSILRAIAGLWTMGDGRITRPSPPLGAFFLPQRPYMTLGTLREQLLYPFGSRPSLDSDSGLTDAQLFEALDMVGLGYLPERYAKSSLASSSKLSIELDWSNMLSLGEQQRLAFARLLLRKPRLAILDESTSALDIASEEKLYKLLQDLGCTVVSVGHRPTLFSYHTLVLRLTSDSPAQWTLESLPLPVLAAP